MPHRGWATPIGRAVSVDALQLGVTILDVRTWMLGERHAEGHQDDGIGRKARQPQADPQLDAPLKSLAQRELTAVGQLGVGSVDAGKLPAADAELQVRPRRRHTETVHVAHFPKFAVRLKRAAAVRHAVAVAVHVVIEAGANVIRIAHPVAVRVVGVVCGAGILRVTDAVAI